MKMKYVLNYIAEACETVECAVDSWLEWREALRWAKKRYPAWAQFATQRKRPEIRTTYRNKIMNAYYKGY